MLLLWLFIYLFFLPSVCVGILCESPDVVLLAAIVVLVLINPTINTE